MIVCGLPGSVLERTCGPRSIDLFWLNAFTTRCTSWNAATEVAAAHAPTISRPPITSRFQSARPGLGTGNTEVLLLPGGGNRLDETHERLAVAGERRHRHPLLGPVVARADGPELHRRHARVEEADGIR